MLLPTHKPAIENCRPEISQV